MISASVWKEIPSNQPRRGRGPGKKNTAELDQLIVQLRQQGLKLHEIVAECRCRPSDVSRATRAAGLVGVKQSFCCEKCGIWFTGKFKRPHCRSCSIKTICICGNQKLGSSEACKTCGGIASRNPHIEEMIEMRSSGCSIQTIGRHFGITGERVRQLLTNSPKYRIHRQCAFCGKDFMAKGAATIACSSSCKMQLRFDDCPRCGNLKHKNRKRCRKCASIAGHKIDADKLRELRESGKSLAAIARELDVSYHSLFTRCRQFGIKNPRPQNRHAADYSLVSQQKIKDCSVVDPVTGCWNWQKCFNPQHYGMVSYMQDGRVRNSIAHRVSYEIFRGKFDRNLSVLHKCDNTRCVNPDHLFLGTAKDNRDDMIAKGRAPWQTRDIKST